VTGSVVPAASMRLDKWLWQARFYKTRSLAARAVAEGRVRVNGARTNKPATAIGVGDGLTLVQGAAVRVVRVREIGTRRGPAAEARGLYDDLAAPMPGACAPGDPSATPAP
jgi:ribosome-associated heat shock protein Hsp15